MAKSEKLFEILNHISKDSNLTPKALAKLCGVSQRAIYRYLNTLSKAGISIRFEDGGYKLKGNYGDLLRNSDSESLGALKLLLSAGMKAYEDDKILEHGKEFMKLIDMNLPKNVRLEPDEIEIIPEQVRAGHYGGTITIGQSSKPDIINPILTSETISVNLLSLIFSGLVRFDSAHRPVPDLAKSWEISDDGLVWTFFLREDVNFHDGHPLTARDVEFTYSSIMDPKNRSPRANRYGPIDRIEAEGDYIFRIFLKHPFMPLISRLGWSIAPRHLLEGVDLRATQFNQHPVGSGPFKFVEWKDDETIILDAFPDYFRRDRPILDSLIFKTYRDRKTALRAISRGEMDIALNLTASDLLFVGKNSTFRIYLASGAFYYALVFNLRDPVFRDIRVRRAFDYAIDKESIIKDQLKEHGSICTGPFGIGSWAYNPKVKANPHSIEKARELLEKAGWRDTDGDGILDKYGKKFEMAVTVSNISDTLQRIAAAIKAQLMELGIAVNLELTDDSKPYEKTSSAILTMISAGTDPEYARRSWHSNSRETNLASYQNAFVDNLMDLGRETADLEKRKAIYHKIHEMIHDDCPAIFLSSAYEYIGSSYRFRNDGFPSITHFLASIRDWQIVGRRSDLTTNIYQEEVKIQARASG